MNWITIIWAMIASVCLTLAAVHGFVWWWRRESRANGIFALSALATAFVAAGELWMMQAETPAQFGEAVRWIHLPGWFVIATLVAFVRVHLRAGRWWLAWTVVGVRTLSLVLNFTFWPNLNFRQITVLRHVPFLGEPVAVAEGVRNPWMLVGQAAFVLLAVFVVDAMVTVWRRGDDRQSRLLSGAIVFFVLAGSVQIILNMWGVIQFPITPSFFYMGIVAAMGLERLVRCFRVPFSLRKLAE